MSFHLDEAVYLSWSALFVALCIHYFTRRSPWPAFAGWAIACAVCLDYPRMTKGVLERCEG